MIDGRIARLERLVRLVRVIVACATVVSVYLVLRKPTDPRWPSALGNMFLQPYGVVVGKPHGTPILFHLAEATLNADSQEAAVGVSVDIVGTHQIVSERSQIVEWNVSGRTDSKILIDTDTGEWTVVRERRGPGNKVISKDESRLVPPLPQ